LQHDFYNIFFQPSLLTVPSGQKHTNCLPACQAAVLKRLVFLKRLGTRARQRGMQATWCRNKVMTSDRAQHASRTQPSTPPPCQARGQRVCQW